MKYDFNHVPDRRGCGSSKWNGMPDASPERVPLSTADMEFYPAPEIAEALKTSSTPPFWAIPAPPKTIMPPCAAG